MVTKKDLFTEEVRDKPLTNEYMRSLKKLIDYYGSIHGFMASHLYRGAGILREGARKSKLRILSFTANIVSTGLRGLLAKVIRDGYFNLIITTCGTIDHDLAKSSGGKYYKGSFQLDDNLLHELKIHRLGNIVIPIENYGPLVEKCVKEFFDDYNGNSISGYELLWELGSRIKDSNSILKAAYEKRTPIIIPGFYDGSFGTNVYIYSRLKNVNIDVSLDEKLLDDIVFEHINDEAMALIVGGGISKHHTIWWSQFRGGLDYTVYVTTAVEYDGSLSGAHPREAVSWGKIKPKSKKTIIYGDATILLPLLLSSLYW